MRLFTRFDRYSLLFLGLILLVSTKSHSALAQQSVFYDFYAPPNPNSAAARAAFEEENRARFNYTQKADSGGFVQIARGYRNIFPEEIRGVIRNFVNNLNMPYTLANHILQANIIWAMQDVGRFTINTTIGIGGLFDPATKIGLGRNDTDLGITLGVWGVGPGPFIFVPFLGPYNFRDLTGYGISASVPNPIYDLLNPPTYVRWTITGLKIVDVRERLIEPLEMLQRSAIDPYTQFKSFYMQSRAAAVQRAKLGPSLDNFAPGQKPPGLSPSGGNPATVKPAMILPGSGDGWSSDKDE